MSIVQFWTPGAIPLDAFTIVGASVKNSDNPIGRFGSGLKYAVAVVLRNGGTIRLFIEGTEWEFYLSKKKFRDQEVQQVRMRKKNGLGKWVSSRALPFTTQMGRDWKLWQAYRELESNTRDENGITAVLSVGPEEATRPSEGTSIEVDCPGFAESIAKENVFLQTENTPLLYRDDKITIWDSPSDHMYSRGIRVYTMRYPSMFTYDFAPGVVTLTEDRSASNIWSIMWDLAHTIQNKVENEELIDRILTSGDEGKAQFENYELDFTQDAGHLFKKRVRHIIDENPGALTRSGTRFWSEAMYVSPESATAVTLSDAHWEVVIQCLSECAEKTDDIPDRERLEGIVDKIKGNF